MRKVEITYINLLIDKYEKRKPYLPEQLDNFYAIDNDKYIALYNDDGHCFVEEFKTEVACILYLSTSIFLEDAFNLDEYIYSLQLKAESNPVLASRTLDKTLTENRLLKEENKRLKEELNGFIGDIKRVAGAIINDSNILLKELKKGEEANVNKK